MQTNVVSAVDTLSVVVPCYNDRENLRLTLNSLSKMREDDEVVIVDSSDDADDTRALVNSIPLKCYVRYLWTNPLGVYSALNFGISNTRGVWVQVLNSGDRLTKNGRDHIYEAIRSNRDIEIHVFAQESGVDGNPEITLWPSTNGIWPHQSIIVLNKIYSRGGLYNPKHKVTADQIYFANIRKTCKWMAHDFVLTYYDLSGLSSSFSLSYSKELFAVWRALGSSVVESFAKSFISPILGMLVKAILGPETHIKLKKLLPRYTQK